MYSPAYSTKCAFIVSILLGCLPSPAAAVKHENFKTCDQAGFCKRNRQYANTATSEGDSWKAPYSIAQDSLSWSDGQLNGIIQKVVEGHTELVRLPITISFLSSGSARVTIDEEKRQKGEIKFRNDSRARKERYNEVENWTIVGGLELSKTAKEKRDIGKSTVTYGPDGRFEAQITFSPFSIDFKRDSATQIKLNDRGLINVEHWRPKIEKTEGKDEETGQSLSEDDSTWWEESFGGFTDSKPRGPESVALDITFPEYEHVYGIPEHASPLSLKTTRGDTGNYEEPYRLYNADVFEYITDSSMTLYGAIPFMQAHKKDSTVGIFWLNAAETWIDVIKESEPKTPLSLNFGSKKSTKTHWFSESGLIDVFVFLGPKPDDVIQAYGKLTGYSQLPQEFALGYHQSRWNYVSDEDVKEVDLKMSKHEIPYDVIWLDIEYTDDKKYFTWDPLTFSNPSAMLEQLETSKRKLVAIIDPHIKNTEGYRVFEEMKQKNLAVQNKDGQPYDGWCWPGASQWVDCFNPATISWWMSLFKYNFFNGTSPNVFLWNDMNEPSVFNGPETTMPKDNLHHGNWEHRDVHNLYGMTFHNASYHAMLERTEGVIRRPFILTRSYFAGSQRLGAMWTGDNQASWDHLAASIPMTINNGISGFPFAGADVGGFFGNPDKDLLTRWYQAGAFYPFFRGHAHIDTRRREPYLIEEPYRSIITQALQLRYSLLPSWYTAFYEASVNGKPILRPHYFQYPGDEAGFTIDDQFFVGSTGLLIKPVVSQGVSNVEIYLPDSEVYYDYFDYHKYTGPGNIRIESPLEKIPILMQGGHIIPRKDRRRRSSGLMRWDPYTLIVALSKEYTAKGEIYIDDGETFDYQNGAFIHREFEFKDDVLQSTSLGIRGKLADSFKHAMNSVKIERIIIVGAPKEWSKKTTIRMNEDEAHLEFYEGVDGKSSWAIVRTPTLNIGNDWKIIFPKKSEEKEL